MHRRHFLALCTGLMLAPSLVLAVKKTADIPAVADGKAVRIPPLREAAELPAVMEFFSFYCPPCYAFSQQYGIDKGIRAVLPPGKQMVKYHVDFIGPLGDDLTQAWSVARVLGIEEKIEPLLFEAVQIFRNLNTPDDIRTVFAKAGVDNAEYDRVLNSGAAKSLTEEQRRLFRELGVTGTPSVYVNARWRMDNSQFRGTSIMQFRAEYISAVAELLKESA